MHTLDVVSPRYRKKCLSVLTLTVLLAGCVTQSEDVDTKRIVSQLFDAGWDDRTLFHDGVVASEQAAINGLLDAPLYRIDLRISEDFLLLQGHEDVRYTNQENESLNEIYFQLFPNITGGKVTVSAVTVDSEGVEPVFEFDESAVRIPLDAPLVPGGRVTIGMDFTVEVPQEIGGTYGLFGYFDGVLVLNEFYPVIPVYDDEKWNVKTPPSHGDLTYCDASFYLVRLTAPVTLKIVSSGREIGRTEDGGTQILALVAGPARDFYIAASESYIKVTKKVGETTVNSYAFPERKEEAESALKTAVSALKSYNERLGTYPYTEFDLVSTPMLAKGMEYSGIVAISEKLYDPEAVISGLPSSVYLESVVAHEVAHQWFYNVVGNDQVDEPWLDEALAQYMTGLYYEDVYGDASSYRASWDSLWSSVNRAEIPIGLPSEAYTDGEYSPIIYGRGPLFLTALKIAIGDFDTFLRDYYQSYKWGIGTTEAFRESAEEHCQCDLALLFESWVYGEKKGEGTFST